MPSGAADASPRPFHETQLYADIHRAKCQAAIARSHRKINSSRPDEFLSDACADPDHWQYDEAQAVLAAWRPTFTVVSRPASDPVWQNDSWQITPTVHMVDGEPVLGELGDFAFNLYEEQGTQDTIRKRELSLSAFQSIGMDAPYDPDVPATPEAKEKFGFLIKPEPEAEEEKVERTGEEDPEFKRQFDALGYLELAARHPHITPQERENLAEGIFRYGLHVAKRRERVLNSAGYLEDAVNGFAMHALQLMDAGKYKDTGKFRGWLSGVWKNYAWQNHTKEAVRQRDSEVGLQTWRGEGEEGRADAGRIREDAVFGSTARPASLFRSWKSKGEEGDTNAETPKKPVFFGDTDRTAEADSDDYLAAKLQELVPLLTTEERRILDRLLTGATHEQVASFEGISMKTVQARRRGIEAKARALVDDNKVQVISIQACADEPQSEPWEAGLIAQMVADAKAPEEWAGTCDGLTLSACAESDAFEPLLTTEEAAAHLRIHVKTLQRFARTGQVPCARIGKYWLFRLSSLDGWVRTHENQPSQPFRVEIQEQS